MVRTPAIRRPWSVPVAIMLKPRSLYCLARSASAAMKPSALPCLRPAATIRFTASVIGRIAELAGNAEEVGEVEMAEPEAVDAFDGGDFLDRLEPLLRLDLGDDEVAPIGLPHLGLRIAGLVVVVGEAEGGASPSLPRISRRIGRWRAPARRSRPSAPSRPARRRRARGR